MKTLQDLDKLSKEERREFWIYQMRQKSADENYDYPFSHDQHEYEEDWQVIYQDNDLILVKQWVYYFYLYQLKDGKLFEGSYFECELFADDLLEPTTINELLKTDKEEFNKSIIEYIEDKGFPLNFRIWDYGRWESI